MGYIPKIQSGNEAYVHHMMLYECHDDQRGSWEAFEHHVNSGYECNTPNMPRDFKKCKGIVAGWGVGGEPFYFPEEAGYPMGEEHGGSKYYMFEVGTFGFLRLSLAGVFFVRRCQNSDHWKFQKLR